MRRNTWSTFLSPTPRPKAKQFRVIRLLNDILSSPVEGPRRRSVVFIKGLKSLTCINLTRDEINDELKELENPFHRLHDRYRFVERHRRALELSDRDAVGNFDRLMVKTTTLVRKLEATCIAVSLNERERGRCVEIAVHVDARLGAHDAGQRRAARG